MTGLARLASTSSSTSPGPGVYSLRCFVISFLPVHPHQLDLCQVQEFERVLINAVILVVYDANHAGIDQHLGTLDAREVCHITRGSFRAHPMQGSLDDGIGFSVDGTYAVPIHHQVTRLITMREPGR